MSFPRYPDYKDSGVAWLGEVPGHWRLSKIKWLYRFVKRQDNADAPVLSVYRDYGVIEKSSRDDNINKTPEDLSLYQTVKIGDLAINKMKAWQGSLGVSPLFGITSPDYAIFEKSHEEQDRFLHYLLRSERMPSVYQTISNGIRPDQWRLEPDKFGHLLIPLPPLQEQSVIIAFLDRETAKIDGLVVEQERLIDLLKEKRQAVISHAVTKGLNPDAPVKDSGIEWLGALPDHWERVQLGRLCRYISDGPHFSPKYVDDGITFLSARNVKVDGWDFDDVKYISDDDYENFSRRIIPEFGDILYTKGGTTGVARVVDFRDKFQVWVHIAVLKIDDLISNPWFVSYALNSIGCYEQSQILTRGATNNDLGLTRMVKIWLALPPILEQSAIVAHLDRETARLDALVAEAQRAIDLLKERRAALISAAVTGRIDVRGLVADNHASAERAPA